MSNSVKSISEFFDENDTYAMPLYQRTYCWRTNKELKQFKADLENIWEAATNDKEIENFLGATILLELKSGGVGRGKKYNVIDGQQRLTTIYLTLLACADYAKENEWDYYKKIRDDYLVHKKRAHRGNVKISPTNHDRKQFNHIISISGIESINKLNASGGSKEGAMTDAYNFLKTECAEGVFKKLGANEDDFERFIEAFTDQFVLADITIDEDKHDPNEVFNRLNTEGLELGVIDIVRNNLFMGITSETDAKNFHKNKWLPFEQKLTKKFIDINHSVKKEKTSAQIEKLTRNQAEDFFFPYATNLDKNIKKKHLANSLNADWKKNELKRDEIIDDMEKYLEPYLTWIPPYQNTRDGYDVKKRIDQNYPDVLKEAIISLKQLRVNKDMLHFLIPILLEVNKKGLSPKKAAQSIKLIESQFIRRALTFHDSEKAGKGMQQKFIRLWGETKGEPQKVKDFFATTDRYIPDDPEFKKGIETCQIYHMDRICRFVIFKYEAHLENGALELYPNQYVEHIDHMNSQEHNEKGKKKRKYEETVHLLGNLFPMSEKLNKSKGCRKIDTKLIDFLKKNSKKETTKEWYEEMNNQRKKSWEPQDIRDRTKKLANWAVKEWQV